MNVFSLNADDIFVALTSHKALAPPPLVLPPLLPHAETCTLGWGGVFAKTSPNVFVQGASAIQLGHDVGAWIPHVPIPPVPPNTMLPAHMAFSSCKALFGKSRVLLNGTPAAWHLPGVAMLQMCADPLPMPVGVCPKVLWRTVKFGFAWDDLLLGYADIAADVALSKLLQESKTIGAKKWDVDVLLQPVKSRYESFVERVASRVRSTWYSGIRRRLWPAEVKTIEHFIDKGGRGWLKKLCGKAVPKSRGGGSLDLLDAREPEPPPAEHHDPSLMFEDGALDEIPLLEGGR